MKVTLGDVKKWFADKGDQTHRVNYPLTQHSIVFDLGAYEGAWAEKIASKYSCSVFAYEPVAEFYRLATEQCRRHPKISVRNYGLGPATEQLGIYYSKDGTTLYGSGAPSEIIQIRSIEEEIEQLKLKEIDLIKINIEGAEYPLLDAVLTKKLHLKMKDIQVQFHIVDKDSASWRDRIRSQLQATHYLTYDYPFVWENWRRK